MSISHSSTRLQGNLDKLFVGVGTTSPIFRSKTSEISSSASAQRPRFESRSASAITFWAVGLGSGSGHLRNNNQQSLSCSSLSAELMMPSLSAANELDNMP
mmetsp:Transcript_30272/g.51854  ORF Transcript_30272/g.51854 Transcript_30272/m.51854 type:complete len:101 (+) Transcript_30272:140-442(+)